MKTLLSFPLIVGALAVLAPFARAGDDGTGVEAGGPAKAAPSPDAADDVLFLKDGREIHGRITGEDDAGYAVKVGGAIRVVEKAVEKVATKV